jgi:hypothetical protein
MTARTAEPLPECMAPGCGMPTKRAVFLETGGLCTLCASTLDDTVRMLPPGQVVDIGRVRRQRLLSQSRPPVVDDAQTVFVERYTPPVPGQLDLPLELPPLLEP